MNLTASERIILHIAEHWRAVGAVVELTQKGIASGAGVRRSHVPRNLKRLISEGYIEAAEGRIGGRARRVNYYKVTEAGLRRAREMSKSILQQSVTHGGKEMTVADVATEFSITPLEVIIRTDETGTFHSPSMALVEVPGLVERDEDMARLKKWAREEGSAMVVYGAAGIGKTALGRAFVSQHRGPHAWVELHDDAEIEGTLRELSTALGLSDSHDEFAKDAAEQMRSRAILLALDGYHRVSEEVVDLLASMIEHLRGSPAKLLVLAQETTPSYCRFYGRAEVARGDVREMHIKGLSIQGCRKMLGSEDIDEEALKRIYLLTKGTPLYLDLIRRGDVDGLRRRSRFTSAEIRLLLFSKGVSSRD